MRSKTVIEREAAEDYLYEFVNTYSGLSIYEIAKKLEWSTGKVYDIVKSLEDSGLIKTQKLEENGRIKKRVYPISWKELLPEDVKEKI
ncbi:MAG: MarR family transcriptional regulator [Archaeoglobaceae archaeon]